MPLMVVSRPRNELLGKVYDSGLNGEERFNANAWSSNHIIWGKGIYSSKYHLKI